MQDLDSRGRLGEPPNPFWLGSATFVVTMGFGLTLFGTGLAARPLAGGVMIIAFGAFGLAFAVGLSLATAQYRSMQQLDEARYELLALHSELDLTHSETEARLHDARAMTAAMGAGLHALERSDADPEITLALINQLEGMRLALSRPSTSIEAVSLHELRTSIQSFATLHQVVVDLQMLDGVSVLANRTHLAEILQSLIDNSRKYAPGSPIDIGSEVVGPYVKIAVDDGGPGIEPEGVERLFSPGVRGADSAQGFGVGLAVARRRAEAMQGALWYEQRPGGGSRFVLRLPIAPAAEPEVPPIA